MEYDLLTDLRADRFESPEEIYHETPQLVPSIFCIQPPIVVLLTILPMDQLHIHTSLLHHGQNLPLVAVNLFHKIYKDQLGETSLLSPEPKIHFKTLCDSGSVPVVQVEDRKMHL
jgi:hypothetical protein